MATAISEDADAVAARIHTMAEKDGIHATVTSVPGYSAQQESQDLLLNGIIRNPLMKDLPAELEALSKHVRFEGCPFPSIPINWRFAESIAYVHRDNTRRSFQLTFRRALKAFEATMLNHLLVRKYKTQPADIAINTDHASLFFMSPMIVQVVKDGKPTPIDLFSEDFAKFFPNQDLHRASASLHRTLATNIYKTKDGRFFHLHGKRKPPKSSLGGVDMTGNREHESRTHIDCFGSVIGRRGK
jgi:hypothetical protein